LCLVGVATAEVSLHAVLQAKWNTFKAVHGKAYNRHEEPQRLNAFLDNTMHIEQHNERFAKGLESFHMGHNEFSDMSLEHFQRTMTTLSPPPPQGESNVTVYQLQMEPSAGPCDWKHTLGPVKNQGGCGSCYAFASLAPMEAQLGKKNQKMILSEQEIVDCTRTYGNNGCNGGWMTGVYDYVVKMGGIALESEYSYKGALGNCQSPKRRVSKMAKYVNVNNPQTMTEAIQTVGPVAVALQAGIRSFQMYRGGVYNDASCNGNIDHGVTAVGYGIEGGVHYYVIRNSWGTGWGENGHMKISRDVCQVSKYGYYPILA